jgi:very-short-patch-repair endonuclease
MAKTADPSPKHEFARQLRRDQTRAEKALWQALRDRRLHGFKFRRQHPIGPFTVDNVCLEKRVIVELDGEHHGLPENSASDAARTSFLEREGYRVLRFMNFEVLEGMDSVLHRICVALGVKSRP